MLMRLVDFIVLYKYQMGKITAATMLETAETELAAKLDAPMSQAVFKNVLHCVSDRYIHSTMLTSCSISSV
jgi:hypothetical protein